MGQYLVRKFPLSFESQLCDFVPYPSTFKKIPSTHDVKKILLIDGEGFTLLNNLNMHQLKKEFLFTSGNFNDRPITHGDKITFRPAEVPYKTKVDQM